MYLSNLLPKLYTKTISEAQNIIDIYTDAGYPVDLAINTVENIKESLECGCKNEFSGNIVELLAEKLS